MKKLLFAIPLLGMGAWAGASWFAGSQAETAYQTLLEDVDTKLPFAVTSDSYESGLTGSTAVTHVRESDSPDAKILFSLEHDIQHSAVSAMGVGQVNMVTRLKKDSVSADAQAALDNFEGGEPFVITTKRALDGTVENLFSLAAYEGENEGVAATLEGGEVIVQVKGDQFIADGELGSISFTDSDGALSISGLDLKGDITRIGNMLFTGQGEIVMNALLVEHANLPDAISIEQLRVDSYANEQGGKVDAGAVFAATGLDVPLELDSVKLDTRFGGLSAEAIENYTGQMQEFSTMDPEQLTVISDDMVGQIIDAYVGMFAPGASINYDLNFTNEGGKADAGFALTVQEDNAENYHREIATVRDLLMALRFELKLDADANAVNRTPFAMGLMTPMAQQFIEADGESYKTAMVTDGLVLNINGEAMPLEDMLGPMLDLPLSAIMAGR